MNDPISNELLEVLKSEIYSGNLIQAIKSYREATGHGLFESKQAIEALEKELRAKTPELFKSPPKTAGCLGMVVGGGTLLGTIIWWGLRA